MRYDNKMTLEMTATSKNESFSRVVAAAFAAQLDPTVAEISDIKTAVSEAVTNAIIHGYRDTPGEGVVRLSCCISENMLYIEITDFGQGITDLKKAMTPLYSSCPSGERSGMGFTVMETFMDSIEVVSEPGKQTTIRMTKEIGSAE